MQPGGVCEHHGVPVRRPVPSQEVVEPREVDVNVVFQKHDPARVGREAARLLQGADLVHPDHQTLAPMQGQNSQGAGGFGVRLQATPKNADNMCRRKARHGHGILVS